MKLEYDNARTRENRQIAGTENIEQKKPINLFAEFYQLQNNQEMSDEQYAFASDLMDEIWEGRK